MVIARECWGGGGVVVEVEGRKEKEEEGRGVYTGGWCGDSNADFHSSNPGATKGKQGEDGVRVSGWKVEKGVTYG